MAFARASDRPTHAADEMCTSVTVAMMRSCEKKGTMGMRHMSHMMYARSVAPHMWRTPCWKRWLMVPKYEPPSMCW